MTCSACSGFLQWRQGDCIVLAETNVLPETDMESFGDDDRMHMTFCALTTAGTAPLVKAMKATRTRPPLMFLRNDDSG